jgi:hypothetical protein
MYIIFEFLKIDEKKLKILNSIKEMFKQLDIQFYSRFETKEESLYWALHKNELSKLKIWIATGEELNIIDENDPDKESKKTEEEILDFIINLKQITDLDTVVSEVLEEEFDEDEDWEEDREWSDEEIDSMFYDQETDQEYQHKDLKNNNDVSIQNIQLFIEEDGDTEEDGIINKIVEVNNELSSLNVPKLKDIKPLIINIKSIKERKGKKLDKYLHIINAFKEHINDPELSSILGEI